MGNRERKRERKRETGRDVYIYICVCRCIYIYIMMIGNQTWLAASWVVFQDNHPNMVDN